MYLIMNIFVIVLISLFSVEGSLIPEPEKKTDGKIVGGHNVTIEEVPYQVSVLEDGSHGCGGSLLKANVVLTAAHCYLESTEYSVRAGSAKINEGGEVIKVASFRNHPKYTYVGFAPDYDIAVIILEKSFTLSDKIKLVNLATLGTVVPDGKMGTVSGWGHIKQGGPDKPTILQAVDVPKFNFNICKANYEKYKANVTDRMICFGYENGGKDSCQGDSGGPLVVDGLQVGVVSWGEGCAKPDYAGVYAKVTHSEIFDFIQENMAEF